MNKVSKKKLYGSCDQILCINYSDYMFFSSSTARKFWKRICCKSAYMWHQAHVFEANPKPKANDLKSQPEDINIYGKYAVIIGQSKLHHSLGEKPGKF